MIDLGSMTDKFTEAGQNVMRRAIELSKNCNHNVLSLSHIFSALIDAESALFAEMMQAAGLDPHSVKSMLNQELSESPLYAGRKMAIPESTRDLLNRALRRARAQRRQQIGSYDLLATLFTDPNGAPAEILRRLGADPALAADAISTPVRAREKKIESLRSNMGLRILRTFRFSELTPDSLNSIATIKEKGVTPGIWDNMEPDLTEEEQRRVEIVVSSLQNKPVIQMNEATIWSRAIYPLLVLAEQDRLEAWAQLPLEAEYPGFGLKGIADGVVGHNISGLAKSFCLVLVQVKQGSGAQDPLIELFGVMLAAARSNWFLDKRDTQLIYGCYTIADNWIFVHGLVTDIETPRPTMTVSLSSAYSEVTKAQTILRVLKSIIGGFGQSLTC
jgi:ClpA/ClpB-like protein